MALERQQHNIAPVFDEHSRILILGSFPSVKSRESAFFYGHPQNRFWKIMAAIFNEEVPLTVEQKKVLLLKHRIAVWDVIASCEIEGSSDSSIRNVVPNDIEWILHQAPIKRICLNGGTAYRMFQKYNRGKRLPEICQLPSSSPANAGYRLEALVEEWKKWIVVNE